MAALCGAFAAYASLIPFDLQRVSPDTAWSIVHSAVTASPRISRSDVLANILLFVPVGFAVAGACLLERPKKWILAAVPLILGATFTLSVLIEFLQIFARSRVPSAADVLAQTFGAALGAGAWIIVGPELTDWTRRAVRAAPDDRLRKALVVYAALWIVFRFAPFDFTLDPGELAQRVRAGQFDLAPFRPSEVPFLRRLPGAVLAFSSAFPIGVLVAVTASRQSNILIVAIAGAGCLFMTELAQIFVLSRTPSAWDAICSAMGFVSGIVAAGSRGARTLSVRLDALRAVSGAGALIWVVVLADYHWSPYDFSSDPEIVKAALARISFVPFSSAHGGSDLHTFSNVLMKLSVAAPFGILAGAATAAHQSRLVLAASVVVIAGMFGAIEAGQVFLPSRFADPTDVFLGTASASAGLAVVRWLLRKGDESLPER